MDGNLATIGVLAVQGAFREHHESLKELGVESSEIKLPHQLADVDGLIIPGGESTTIARLIEVYDLRSTIVDRITSGLAVWGTCAGMIILASHLSEERPKPLQLMNIKVSRNAFGRQADSFEEPLRIKGIGSRPFNAIFIRAPIVDYVGTQVKILATLSNGNPVAVQQHRMLATSFHPELSNDLRMHHLFMRIVEAPREVLDPND